MSLLIIGSLWQSYGVIQNINNNNNEQLIGVNINTRLAARHSFYSVSLLW